MYTVTTVSCVYSQNFLGVLIDICNKYIDNDVENAKIFYEKVSGMQFKKIGEVKTKFLWYF